MALVLLALPTLVIAALLGRTLLGIGKGELQAQSIWRHQTRFSISRRFSGPLDLQVREWAHFEISDRWR